NINADTAAGALASALHAEKLIMLTDVEGVLDGDGELMPRFTSEHARELLTTGIITGGMIPKLETCLAALDAGVDAAHILDGRLPHVLLLEIFTEAGVGTKIGGDAPPR
ncbi:MAG: acetylglutamate kinase, partial [Geminicoccaceae bacterium]